MKGPSSALIPLAIVEAGDGQGDQPLRNCIGNELVVASPTAFSPQFRLPDDWTVRKRRRRFSLGARVDKYYYEPGTGREFRSLRSVQKHLMEMQEGLITSNTRKPDNEGDMSRLEAYHPSRDMQIVSCTSPFKLPDNWIVEEKHRSNIKHARHIDRYYIEPETGQRFRSLIAAKRYLTAVDEYSNAPKALTSNQFTLSNSSDSSEEEISDDDYSLQVFRNLIKAKKKSMPPQASKPASQSMPSKATSTQKKNTSLEKDDASVLDSTSPPTKINWVMSGTGGNLFSPFMGDSMIPQSVKRKWSEAFTLALQD